MNYRVLSRSQAEEMRDKNLEVIDSLKSKILYLEQQLTNTNIERDKISRAVNSFKKQVVKLDKRAKRLDTLSRVGKVRSNNQTFIIQ